MKRIVIIFFQAVIVLMGIGAFEFMLWEPHVEGVNAHATFFQVYNDPFLVYAYLASIFFFVALYKTFILLGYSGDKVYSRPAVEALRTIKYCAIIFLIFVIGAVAYSFIFVRGHDDIAGGVMVGNFLIIVSIIVALVAAKYERFLQKAIDTKHQHDSVI